MLGIAIRADVPLPLDLLGSVWKGLVGEVLDPDADLQEADVLTYNYIKKFESVRHTHWLNLTSLSCFTHYSGFVSVLTKTLSKHENTILCIKPSFNLLNGHYVQDINFSVYLQKITQTP